MFNTLFCGVLLYSWLCVYKQLTVKYTVLHSYLSTPVIPEMTFEASQLAVHHGDNFELTCTVRGFPTNTTTIKTRTGVELKNQIRGRLDTFTTRAFVPITGSEDTEFLC